jgi:hypothetical protein
VCTTYPSRVVSRCSKFGFTTFSSARNLSAPNISRAVSFSSARQTPREHRQVVTATSNFVVPNLKFIVMSSSVYYLAHLCASNTQLLQRQGRNEHKFRFPNRLPSSYLPSTFIPLFQHLSIALTLSLSLSLHVPRKPVFNCCSYVKFIDKERTINRLY